MGSFHPVVSTKEDDISQRMTCARSQRYPKSRQKETLRGQNKATAYKKHHSSPSSPWTTYSGELYCP